MRLIDDNIDWQAYEEEPERAKVISPKALAQEVIDAFYGDAEKAGDLLPWDKAQERFRLRSREVTVWAGINGHRKSMITSQIALGLMRQGKKVLIASLEMRPAQTMQRMTRQAAATECPSIPYIRAFHRWTDGKLWIYDHLGHCEPSRILAVCRYAARELGCEHLVIDSMMKIVAGTDDYTGQKVFVGDLCALALAHGVHVHLVAHAKKAESERDALNKFSVKGASEIGDQVDNLVLVQKNLRKAEKIAAGVECDEHDQFLTVAKQRNGEYEGTMGLFFDSGSLGFVEREGGKPTPLVIQREPGEDDE